MNSVPSGSWTDGFSGNRGFDTPVPSTPAAVTTRNSRADITRKIGLEEAPWSGLNGSLNLRGCVWFILVPSYAAGVFGWVID
jgi:hypothetical protein